MQSSLDFDCIQFRPYDWNGFKQRYRGAVRCVIAWDRIKKPKMGLSLLEKSQKINLVWYEGGDWRDGKPKKFGLGDKLALVRIPCCKVGDAFVALDGNHRLTSIKPKLVLIDWFEPKLKDRVYVTDLLNKAYSKL